MKYVLTNEQMREADAFTIKQLGVPALELMERAGVALYETAKELAGKGKILCVCGSGNNGGDGYVLALEMKENNLECEIILVKDKFSTDGEYYFNKCKENNIPYSIYNETIDFNKYDFIVFSLHCFENKYF